MPESPNHEAMPQAHDLASASPEKPADPDATRSAVEQLSPGKKEWIGPYKLLEPIGQGGMGVVYMAEQEQPVRRRVALKLIKPGMDSAQVIARFRAEQQALALMDHQNIAKVYDAGTTTAGRPYFVMELVHGVPITKYCDDNKLTPRERLELFIPVCRAVQHAHQKGIIHRDLKPSNVLVCLYDGKPVAKVIDFGVAKAMEQPLTDGTMYTHFGQVIGTLEYMSPEQAEMSQLGIDTRSDIYSLGVMVYELLTGSTPLQKQRVKKAALDEILKLIREEEPQPPSSRLSNSTETLPAISQQRRTDPGQLTKLVRGELDWIVMKSLEKDRTRRYGSADGMAQDIERYLADEPVEACPPSATYRLRKYANKHRVLLTTAAAFALLLIAGTTVSVWQAIRATNAESDATLAKSKADKDRDDAITARKGESAANLKLGDANETLRHKLYASDLNLVQAAWNNHQTHRALDILEQHRPKGGETELRGFEWFYWMRKLKGESRRIPLERYERSYPNYTVPILSPSTRYCADIVNAGNTKSRLRCWDTTTGQRLWTVDFDPLESDNDTRSVWGQTISFAADDSLIHVEERRRSEPKGLGELLVSQPWSGRITAFSARDGASVYVLHHKTHHHPDGKRLLQLREPEAEKSGQIVWLDAKSGAETKRIPIDVTGLEQANVSPDFRQFALLTNEAGKPGSEIRVWDTETGKTSEKLPLPEPRHQAKVRFSPDGRFAVVCPSPKVTQERFIKARSSARRETFDFHAMLYFEVETGKLLWSRPVPPSVNVFDASYIPGGEFLLLESSQRPGASYSLIDRATGLREIPLKNANEPLVDYEKACIAPEGGLIVLPKFSGRNGNIVEGFMVASAKTGSVVFESPAEARAEGAGFSSDGKRFVAVDAAGVARSWEIAPWQANARAAATYRASVRGGRGLGFGFGLPEVHDHGKRLASIPSLFSFTRLLKGQPRPEQHLRMVELLSGRELPKWGPVSARNWHQGDPLSSQVLVGTLKEDRWQLHLIDAANGLGRQVGEMEAAKLGSPQVFFLPRTRHVLVLTPKAKDRTNEPKETKVRDFASHARLLDFDAGAFVPSWWDAVRDLSEVRFSDDGRTALLLRGTSPPRKLSAVETASGKVLWELPDDDMQTKAMSADPQCKRVLLLRTHLGKDRTSLEIRSLATGAMMVCVENTGLRAGGSIVFSPRGDRVCFSRISSLSMHQNVSIWDTAGNMLCEMTWPLPVCTAPIFNADGTKLYAVRAPWTEYAPGELLEVIDATPLPGDEPTLRAALKKEGTR